METSSNFHAFAGVVWMPLVNAAPTDLKEREAAGVEALMTRVGPPSEEAVEEFKRAGMAVLDRTFDVPMVQTDTATDTKLSQDSLSA